ncbi:MAG: 4-hydroxythreonine-4-phosphate dehydrogenase PdxA [bacterium]
MVSGKPIVGITMGDAAGIGPEIIVRAFVSPEVRRLCRPLVVGDSATIQDALNITRIDVKVEEIERVADARFAKGVIEVLDLHNIDHGAFLKGRVDPVFGKAAFEYIRRAVDLALSGKIQAIVTAPLNKESLNKAGYHYSGHTEILAELCGVKEVCMMLIVGNLRVAHVSGHLPLTEACRAVKKERVLTVIRLGFEAVKKLGIPEPSVAVAGLNPHAGEMGLFGREEITEILPAVKEARSQGMNVAGPIPPDTVFYRAKDGEFDLVIAMYHDQGHIPLKLWDFSGGVSITLGLPLIRTSVDHGTAFDRAGRGTASPKSLIAAIRLATQLVNQEVTVHRKDRRVRRDESRRKT